MIYEIHINTNNKEEFESELKLLAEKYKGLARKLSDIPTFINDYDFNKQPLPIIYHYHPFDAPQHGYNDHLK
jgi:hypothetical protein